MNHDDMITEIKKRLNSLIDFSNTDIIESDLNATLCTLKDRIVASNLTSSLHSMLIHLRIDKLQNLPITDSILDLYTTEIPTIDRFLQRVNVRN